MNEPQRRFVVYTEIGNMPASEVPAHLESVTSQLKDFFGDDKYVVFAKRDGEAQGDIIQVS